MHVVNDALKDSSRGSTSDRSRNRFRSVLLVAEIAVSFVLLIATGLLISSFVRHPQRRSRASVPNGVFVRLHRRAAERSIRWRSRSLRRISTRASTTACRRSRARSRSRSATIRRSAATTGQSPYAVVGRPLPPPCERPLAIRHLISPNRFALLGIPVKAGRDFDERDTLDQPAGDHHQRGDGEEAVPEREPARAEAGHRRWRN